MKRQYNVSGASPMVGKALKNFDRNISITDFVAEDLGSILEENPNDPPKSDIQWMDPKSLHISPHYEEIYGSPIPDGGLLLSIEKNKILEPIVISKSGTIISGAKRWKAGLELNLEEVPVRIVECDGNAFNLVSHNVRREKDFYTIFNEIKVLKPLFNPGRGYRSDLRKKIVKLDEFLGVKINLVQRLWNIHLKSVELFGEGTENYIQFTQKLKDKSINHVQLLLEKKLNQRTRETLQIPSPIEGFQIYPKSSLNPLEVSDQSVQSIIVSPPYFRMRNYGNETDGNNELGREKSADEFVDNLVSIFCSWKRILKPDGCLVINISESSKGKDGFPMTIERLLIGLKKEGFSLQYRLYWFKNNPVYCGNGAINNAVEEIFIFSLNGVSPFINTQNLDPNMVQFYGENKILNVINGNVNQPVEVNSILKNNGFSLTHTAMMPEYLAEVLIKLTSNEGDFVFDGFSGLGTTGRVACKSNRKFVGYEINDEYFNQALILASQTLKIAA
jgi:DNA modification methylase